MFTTLWPNGHIVAKLSYYTAIAVVLFGQSCSTERANKLFVRLTPEKTGIDFRNAIVPTDSLDLLDYEYLYNGGGVGIGDFDNDGLPDIVFTGNQVPSRIYLNQDELQFTDITESSGFDTDGKWCTGVTVVDINYDGYDDIYVCVGGPDNQSTYPNLLFVNQGDNTFREAAREYGLADSSESNHAVFFDYDRDGDLDLYLLNGGGFERSAVTIKPMRTDGSSRNTDRLYENTFNEAGQHPVYKDVSRRAGITYEGFGLSVGIIDVNADNWPDIYVSNDYLSKDLLYLNQQDGTFTEEANDYFNHTSHFSMGNAVADINNDGFYDLVTLDMLPADHFRRMTMFGPNQQERFDRTVNYGYGYQYMRNMLQIGNGSGHFQELGQLAGIDRTDWSWCPLVADLDNDGRQDIYITNGYGKNITDLDFVKFRQDAVSPFSGPEEVATLLKESLAELPAIILPNYCYQNTGYLEFTDSTEDWGLTEPSISNGAAYADLDCDGDLELITNNINSPAFIYHNNLRENTSDARFLSVSLRGSLGNPNGIGSRLTLYGNDTRQYRQQQPVGGYQSSGTKIIHFGLGRDTLIDSLRVIWPDGKQTLLKELATNQFLTLEYDQATPPPEGESKRSNPLLTKVVASGIVHQEVITPSDFANQPLLPHNFTNQGPGIAVGDVNQDGLDDIFLGTGYGSSASLLIQQGNGAFIPTLLPTDGYEDLGAIFLDVDADSDLDLYVTSGGTERYADHPKYQDRIYVNDGRGNFQANSGLLPEMLSSTAAVAGGDFNQDGATDLFVGGRVTPGNYPLPPRSYLLQNTGGKYVDVTARICSSLKNIGMVTSALWTDFNGDYLQDLIVVGEMMKITVFENDGTQLVDVSDRLGLQYSAGMWNSISSGDFDDDGDVDYVVGNIGENTAYRLSPEHPLRLHYADFDNNGTVDPIFSMYEADGDYYPVAALDMMATQLPKIKKKFLSYHRYANATTGDLLSLLDTTGMQTLVCHLQESVFLENIGGEKFALRPLPRPAQVAPVKGIISEDLNADGTPDLLLVGNEYHREVTNGNLDASLGLVLLNRGGLEFSGIVPGKSGLLTKGDTRSVVRVARGENQDMILITRNDAETESYLLGGPSAGSAHAFRPGEVSATLEFEDGGSRKIEHHLGGGYLSQSSGTIRTPEYTKRISFKNSSGQITRTVVPSQKENQQ